MKDNGYEDMAKLMESIGKDGMIRMHNAMGGAQGCHQGDGISKQSTGMSKQSNTL